MNVHLHNFRTRNVWTDREGHLFR